MTDLGTLGGAYATSEAVALNKRGDVIGSSRSGQWVAASRSLEKRKDPRALSRVRVRSGRRDQ